MATAQMEAVIRHLRRVVLRQDGAGRTDGQLLASFIEHKDEAAFEALVHRHGPMVFGVCRRVVGHYQDAEDAFQATFLVLARKASSVKQRERVANWLHGVAHRTAMKAKALTAKRRGREKQVTEMPEPEASHQNQWRDLHSHLDQELNRLADVYRLPILLCDLEGQSIKKTAQQLGWPQGTVAGRLARGRKLLSKRLARYSLAITGGATFLQDAASGSVSPMLMASTIKASSAIVSGKPAATGLISANVAVLMKGVLSTMFMTKIKVATAVLMVGTMVVLGGGMLLSGTAGGQQAEVRGHDKPATQQVVQSSGKPKVGKNEAATAKTEHEKLRGTWRLVERISHGKTDTPSQVTHWWIGKDKIAMERTDSPRRQYASYHFWGDNDDTTPAAHNIDMTLHLVDTLPERKEYALHSETLKGIYELHGEQLKLCFRVPFGNRPAKIPADPAKEDNLLVWVLQRETAAPTTDEEKLQGDWQIVGGEVRGEKIGKADLNPHLSFVGDLMIIVEEQNELCFQLDTTTAPKQIAMTYKSGNVEQKVVGIFSLDGNDMRICFPEISRKNKKTAIPDDFTAPKDSGRQLFILKRVIGAGVTDSSARRKGVEAATPEAQDKVPNVRKKPDTQRSKRESAPEYVVESPDILLVEVSGLRKDSNLLDNQALECLVQADGTITLGKCGSISAGGRTISNVRAGIIERLTPYADKDGTLDVQVKLAGGFHKYVYIIFNNGEDVYRVDFRGETVVDAIYRAGEANKAIKGKVWLTGPGSGENLKVDWRAITQQSKTETNYVLRPGDRVYIESPAPHGKKTAAAGNEKQGFRIGQIIVVGNTKTPDAVIRDQIDLFPGQVLDEKLLRKAEERLGTLKVKAIISDSPSDRGSDYRDIMVTVTEQGQSIRR
jgi:RNA polymerase sigma factor (sigma-70 family)